MNYIIYKLTNVRLSLSKYNGIERNVIAIQTNF